MTPSPRRVPITATATARARKSASRVQALGKEIFTSKEGSERGGGISKIRGGRRERIQAGVAVLRAKEA